MFGADQFNPQSNYTGDINYGTHLTPVQLHKILDAKVRLQYNWAQILASPFSYPTHYEFSGPSLKGGGGFAFKSGQSSDSALTQVALAATSGTVEGIVQLENLQSLRGPFGYGSIWWQVGPPETLPDFLTRPHPLEPGNQGADDRPTWVGDRPGLPAKWQVFPPAYPLSTCWGHVPSEFSAFGYSAPKGFATPGLPPEMSLF